MPNNTIDPKIQKEPILQQVLKEIGEANQSADRVRNESILKNTSIIPQLEKDDKKLIVYMGRVGSPNSAISADDIAPFGSMLSTIGEVNNLDLMIHSPGGNGVVAEKIVDMCRSHCKQHFRVIVPNMAKSAATLISLGANEIVMGYCSELGPIDPQKIINIGGVLQQISAQSFIQARKNLLKELQKLKTQKQDITGLLQQLAFSSMDPAFILECEKEVEFAKDFVKKRLPDGMLKNKFPSLTSSQRVRKASSIAKNLTSTNKRFIHGRMINPAECGTIGLNITELKRDDPDWEKIFELYVRAEVFMMINSKPESQAGKLFMDGHTHLLAF